ncbi:chymotrypsin-like protease CTRL-1 isoform X2 [Acanthochromis polyacanthus]|uniref:chymotrypsin-like protease CTRL-1 isoform X2 n=1 Tax=Acanthochromis polyacanthus TaxID=80966 RepID=UPI002233F651|nr:chymotrypsin-like protease CTRL-1 isoform X2 [Acanthochromis polyacanthus]
MGLQQVVWGVTVVIFVFCKGCHSQPPAYGSHPLNTRTIGGQTAAPGSWSWHAALNISGNVSCSGSLISNEWILTAAHCITLKDLNTTVVHLGLQNLSGSNPGEVIRRLADIVCYPFYNSTTFEDDICLLKLSSPVTITTYIQPVYLAAANSTFYNGTSSWVTGYGITGGPLQEANIPIIGNKQCQCYHRFQNITKNMICAGRRDSCQGDSGGPLMSNNGSVFVQSGVASWAVGCAQLRSPGVYTRVSRYHRWINYTVTGMRPRFVTFMSTGNNSDLNFTCHSPPPFSTPYPPFNDTYPPFPTRGPHFTFYPPFTYPPFTTDYPPFRPRPCDPNFPSAFCAGENLIHFTNFVALSVLALVLQAFVGSG